MKASEKAKQYFLEGYNCSQAVVLAFKEQIKISEDELKKLASPFGGGMARLRETCGAFSGMIMVFGYLYGTDNPDPKAKEELYKHIQNMANEFKKANGFLVCRQLLNLDHTSDNPTPAKRDANYYHSRKCVEIVMNAADILERYLLTLKR